jgi:methyl-accepting chemotaxis protein
MADGDLSKKLKLSGRDDFAWLAYEYDSARRSLVKLVTDLSQHSASVSGISSQLADDSQEISHSTRKQSEAASSIATAIEEMATSANHVADNAQQAHILTSEAGEASQAGVGVIGKVVEEVTNIALAVQESSAAIEELGKQSDQIRSIIKVINDVAEQTNLLALNAAIEAARAGEQGRGFAEVADEVRKLAERTAESTKEIGKMIKAISVGTAKAVESMQQGVVKVESGVNLAQEAGTAITSIDERTQRVVMTVSDISNAVGEQRNATNEIACHVERIAQMSETNTAATQSTGETAKQLSSLSQSLEASVARFRL